MCLLRFTLCVVIPGLTRNPSFLDSRFRENDTKWANHFDKEHEKLLFAEAELLPDSIQYVARRIAERRIDVLALVQFHG